MSQYANVYGRVTVDDAAAAVLMNRSLHQWVVPPADGLHVGHRDGCLVLDFGGACYRNLGRCVLTDLAHAARVGRVTGAVTIDVQDGCHVRDVAIFEDGVFWFGDSECFVAPTVLRPAQLRCLWAGDDPDHAIWLFEADPSMPDVRIVSGAQTVVWCGCGGYDELRGSICATVGGPAIPQGTSSGGEEVMQFRIGDGSTEN